MAKQMQKAAAVIRVGGSLLQTVRKSGITPAELVILRKLHGQDSITQLELERTDFTEQEDERSRLEKRYGELTLQEAFPGHSKELPTLFSDVGVKINMETRKTRRAREMELIDDDSDLDDEEYADLFIDEPAT